MFRLNHRRRSFHRTILAACACALIGLSATATAGVDCNARPDHPKCSDGGGSGDPDPNACLTSESFPTFAFWGPSKQNQPSGLYLSDAEGACVQQISQDGGPCLLSEMKMHYSPPASAGDNGWGRVMYRCFDDHALTEFTVAPDNSVSVSKDMIPVMLTVEGRVGDLDIASDGDTIAFSYHWPDTTGDGNNDGASLYLASIDDCLDSMWIDNDPTSCNGSGSLQEIISVDHSVSAEIAYWSSLSWNHDNTSIYLKQPDYWSGQFAGIQVAEQVSPGVWDYSPVVSYGQLGGTPTFLAAGWDSQKSSEVLAFRLNFNDDRPCTEIYMIDIEACRGPTAQCDSLLPQTRGRTPSFTNDGRLVFNILKPKGRTFCNNPERIAIMDPFAPGSSPMEIADGTDPDG